MASGLRNANSFALLGLRMEYSWSLVAMRPSWDAFMVLRELKLTLQGRSPSPHGSTARHPGEASDRSQVVFFSGGLYWSEASLYSGALGISVAAGSCKSGYRGGGEIRAFGRPRGLFGLRAASIAATAPAGTKPSKELSVRGRLLFILCV